MLAVREGNHGSLSAYPGTPCVLQRMLPGTAVDGSCLEEFTDGNYGFGHRERWALFFSPNTRGEVTCGRLWPTPGRQKACPKSQGVWRARTRTGRELRAGCGGRN